MNFQFVLLFCINLAFAAKNGVSGLKNNAYLLQDHKSYSLAISVTNQNGFKPGSNDSQIFIVQAPKYHRIMIVIQQLHLWPEIGEKLAADSAETYQSYLQFVDSDGTESEKIYGNIDPDENELVPPYLTGPRSFASTEDTASLVFINLRLDRNINLKNERRVYAKVVFTAFRDTCSYRWIPPPTQNHTEVETMPRHEMLYRSCITSSATGKNCIPADLFCDTAFNCAETGPETFGIDEAYVNCDEKSSASRSFSTPNQPADEEDEVKKGHNKKSGDLTKTLIVDQEYDEYFTELFKSVIIGFLGLCTTCILIAFVVTMFCLKNNTNP